MIVSVAFRTMHAPWSEDRRQLLGQLETRLGPIAPPHSYAVIADTDRAGVWPTARRAWADAVASQASHVLVLQDDVHPCPHVVATVEQLIGLRPSAPLVLASSAPLIDRVTGSWAASRDGSFGGATVLPRSLAADFLAWNQEHFPEIEHLDRPDIDIGDDYRLTLYFVARDLLVYTPVPGLMTHLGKVSLLGHRLSDAQMRPRRFIGLDGDPRTIDWSAGFFNPPMAPRLGFTARFAKKIGPERAQAAGLTR